MSNYVKNTNFASKDNLASGNPLKIVKGTEIDTEFNNIATAISTKQDSSTAGDVTLAGVQTLTNKTIAYADNTLTGVVGLSATQTLANKTLTSPVINGGSIDGELIGFRNIPQNSQSAAYTLVSTDAGRHIFHPSSDNNARTFTIPSNASVPYPIGTAITFINMAAANVTIAITTDTLTLSPAGTTGARTLATNGSATCIKITATQWLISGSGLA